MDPITMAMIAQAGGQVAGGLFGNSGKPYSDYGREVEKYNQRGIDAQNPFYNAGKHGMSDYQDWLGGQKDPSKFINDQMKNYQTSDYAKMQMGQAQNAANNAASASGLMGSTPFMQESQNYAQDIASKDQNQWLQNVLGINSQYGQGQKDLMGVGQHSADQITGINQNLGESMGQAAYGERQGRQKDIGNIFGGVIKGFTG